MAAFGPRRGGNHLLTLDLGPDEVEHPLAILVGVPLGLEGLVRELPEELHRELELALPDLGRRPLVDLAEVAHLVGEVHRVEHEAALGGADQHQRLLAAHDELGQRHPVALRHRLGQESVRLLAPLVGAEVIGLLEVDRVDPVERHELGDVDDLRRLALERLELGVRDPDILILGELEALHEVAALDDLVVERTDILLPDAGAALGVQEVVGDALGGRGRVEFDRDRHEAEGDGARSERVRHDAVW